MNNQTQVFTSSEFGSLSITEINGKPYFPATQCAEILGYSNPRKAIIDHCKGVTKCDSLSMGGSQATNYIPEGDLYRLIVRSKMPAAERFEKWVFDEVLPSVRKHGIYATEDVVRMALDDPTFVIGILSEIKQEREAHALTAQRLEEKTLQLDESTQWFTVKRIAFINHRPWQSFDWRRLKNTSAYLGYPVQKVFDANYGEVNAYHIDVWKHEYAGMRFAGKEVGA
jgi:prophage antirepressor-like protein